MPAMSSPRMCMSNMCKRSARALCYCCQQHICVDHLKEHSDLLNSQLTPLAEQINKLFEQFNDASLLKPTFLTEIDSWRQEAHQEIDRFCEGKKQEFEGFVLRERNEEKKQFHRIFDRVNELIQKQEGSQDQIDLINDSLRTLRQRTKLFQHPQFTRFPLVIDDELLAFDEKRSKLNNILPLSTPYQTIKRTEHSFWSPIAANDNHLLAEQAVNLCLLDQQLIVKKHIIWPHDDLYEMFWSTALAQFILITDFKIFTLDEKTMTLHQCPITCSSNTVYWSRGTCLNETLFLSTSDDGSSIFEYTLFPSIKFVKEYLPPSSCTKDENISDLASNNNALALLIWNRQKQKCRLDLCSPTTLQRDWSIELDSLHSISRCCSLMNDHWMVIDRESSELIHISANGKLVKRVIYGSSPYNIVQWGNDKLVIMTKESLEVHHLS